MLAASLIVNVWQCSEEQEPEVVVERDTVWRDTTLYEPQPAETINTGRTVYIRIPVPVERDTITLHDSIDVPVPIYQKRYEDSLYTAWVSGYEPNLDSIRLYQPTIIETVTKTITKPAPRFSFGLQGGIGYGIITRKPDVYVGVGGQVRLGK